jgi:putative phage-type endonuclease
VISKQSTANHEEWKALRHQYIGGSDAAAVVGMNAWVSPYALWAEKTGRLPGFEGNLATEVGTYLEEFVAQKFVAETGKKVRKSNQSWFNDQYPWAIANIDREIVGEDAGLEIKTTSELNIKKFKGGEYPANYYCQCMHYMAVMGYEKMYLAVLVLGQAFYWFEIERNEAEIESLIGAEVDFWQNYVLTNTPPPVDGSDSTSQTLAEIYETNNEGCTLFGFESEARAYIDIGRKIKELKELQEQHKNALLAEMEGKVKADLNGYEITNKPTSRTSINSKKLKAEMPDIYDKYSKTTESARFTIKEVEAE